MNNKKIILSLMKTLILALSLIALCACVKAEAKHCGKTPIRIVVLDTGFGYGDSGHESNLCKYGHKDFSPDKKFTKSYATRTPVPVDFHGHGTNIVGIIDDYAKKAHTNYCIVVVKYYSEKQNGYQSMMSMIEGIKYAANIKADFVNISGGGGVFEYEEYKAVKRFLSTGGKLVAAAGNEQSDLDLKENAYYPAMYDARIIIVGNHNKNGVKYKSSNYGSVVKRLEIGEDVTAYGITMTGTSQATAVATGKIVSESDNKCDIGLQ